MILTSIPTAKTEYGFSGRRFGASPSTLYDNDERRSPVEKNTPSFPVLWEDSDLIFVEKPAGVYTRQVREMN